jgi:hypothetical protein
MTVFVLRKLLITNMTGALQRVINSKNNTFIHFSTLILTLQRLGLILHFKISARTAQ